MDQDEVIDQTGEAGGQTDEQDLSQVDDQGAGDAAAIENQDGAAKPAEPAFEPDFKFRANQQDMEIPEEFRAHIKDVESQKKIKDIFEKYHGFDTQKTKVSTLEAEANKYRGDYEKIVSNFQGIQQSFEHAVQSGNMHNLDMVFQKLGLTEDVLMSWAGEKAKLAALEPAQREAILKANKLERDVYERTQYQNSLMTENQQKDLQIRQMQYDSAMSSPQIQSFASELDTKFGMNGFFGEEVKRAGEMAWALEKKVLSVPEAMQVVITKYGLKGVAPATPASAGQGQPGGQGQANGQQGGAGNVDAQGRKIIRRDTKVIPNVGSAGGASPVGAGKAKNLDEVRKRYQELVSQDGGKA